MGYGRVSNRRDKEKQQIRLRAAVITSVSADIEPEKKKSSKMRYHHGNFRNPVVTTLLITQVLTLALLYYCQDKPFSNEFQATEYTSTTTSILINNTHQSEESSSSRSTTTQKANVVVKHVETKMRNDPIPVTIIIPSLYYETDRNQQQFPVVYLLHGAGANHLSWNRKTDIALLAESYNILVVCPNGELGWYFDSPVNPRSQYETFISQELVEYMDQTYRTLSNKDSRALMGSSMGGHGAIFLGIRHSGVFGTAIGLSTGADIRPFAEKWDLPQVLGSIDEYPQRWNESTVIHQVEPWALQHPVKHKWRQVDLSIVLDVGTGDFFLDVNRALHSKLLELKVPHQYSERPGGHGWSYWSSGIKHQMLFLNEVFLLSKKNNMT